MDDGRIGAALRAVRVRRRWRQADVARAAGVTRETIIRLERGVIAGETVAALRAVAVALDMRVELSLRWLGADLDRLLSDGHAAMHESLAAFLAEQPGWESTAEVSFSVFGERGIIDIVAWHAETRSLLVIELKTALGDAQELVGVMDRRMRLARQIVADRGWRPLTVSCWVIFAESRTNRRHVSRHRGLLGGAFPADGHALRTWLRRPAGRIRALSFWTDVAAGDTRRQTIAPRRVRLNRAERAEHALTSSVTAQPAHVPPRRPWPGSADPSSG